MNLKREFEFFEKTCYAPPEFVKELKRIQDEYTKSITEIPWELFLGLKKESIMSSETCRAANSSEEKPFERVVSQLDETWGNASRVMDIVDNKINNLIGAVPQETSDEKGSGGSSCIIIEMRRKIQHINGCLEHIEKQLLRL